MSKTRKKILVIQLTLQPPGGGNTVASWILEALKNDYSITLLSWMPVELEEVNRYYGTELSRSEIRIKTFPGLIRRLVDALPGDPWHFQGYCLMMRWCRIIRNRYDLLLSSSNETDFGNRGIQYIHYPYQKENFRKESSQLEPTDPTLKILTWLRIRLQPWRIISGFSFDRVKQNLTLTNSHWTSRVINDVYGTDSMVVYPPVPGDFPPTPWEERKNGFVCIGRLSNEKRYEGIIDALAAVRRKNSDIQLHIIGSPVDYDQAFYKHLKNKVSEYSSWVFLHEDVSRNELIKLVTANRYGIHGMKDEHFGIAVAEMVRGGCIPFIPDDGGQVEIIGNESRLQYHTFEEAVEKISGVLDSPESQISLRKHLEGCRKALSTERFTSQIREIVQGYLE